MTPSREDLELYVSGNYDGDVGALERAIGEDPQLAALLADEAKLDMLLRDAAAHATFCISCNELVRSERCDSCGAAVRPGGYTIERVLVSNAHGRMYVARDADGKRVALKELAFVHAPSADAHAAFEREAKFLRALEHPAIPRFLASFEEGSGVHTRYYLAQELVEGTPLDRLDEHWYSEAEIVEIAKQVLGVLVYLQSLSPMVIHRDIKPANLVKRGDGSIALVDFGAAHVQGTTVGSTTIGTFGYMPVEQLAGIVDATTDCYALGATLLYLLTRQEPWRLQQTKTTVNASAPLRAYLDKLIATDPRARFATAKDALAALDRREELVHITKQAIRPRKRWLLVAAAASTLALGTGVFALLHTPEAEREANRNQALGVTGLKIVIEEGGPAKVLVDGQFVMFMRGEALVPLAAGKHRVRLLPVGHSDNTCDAPVEITAGQILLFKCSLPQGALDRGATQYEITPAESDEEAQPRLKGDKKVSWTFNKSPLHDVMRLASTTCGFNVVVPGALTPKITIRLVDAPCDQAVEVMLLAQGLDYAYDRKSNLVLVGKVDDVDDFDFTGDSTADADELLPAGGNVDVDVKQAPLRDMLAMIASRERQNLVIPEGIQGRVTIRAINAPWERVFDAVLDASGLEYTYRKNSKIILVSAPEPDPPAIAPE